VWTQTLTGALHLFGVRDKAARQTIARMQSQGWLIAHRVGRRTRLTLSDQARELLSTGADRIYPFGAEARSWDHRWALLLASVPEENRRDRYRMATALRWAGFGPLGPGIWICPWIDREVVAAQAVGRLGIEATMFVAEVGSLGSAENIVGQAWDLDQLRAEYQVFLEMTDAVTDPSVAGLEGDGVDGQAAGTQAVRTLTRLVDQWRRFPLVDPGLPREVLPPDWPSAAAARRFAQCRAMLRPRATEWWADSEQRYQ
jgi:phenylacetic acid degradation operon negative regulatory protein